MLERPPKWEALENLLFEIRQTDGDTETKQSVLAVCKERERRYLKERVCPGPSFPVYNYLDGVVFGAETR